MDDVEFESSTFRRVYQYLRWHDGSPNPNPNPNPNLLDQFMYEGRIEGDITDCLQHLLK
jgi:hypothetical protein